MQRRRAFTPTRNLPSLSYFAPAGGGQERGLRSGTVPHPLVVGLGKACEIAKKEMEFETQHVRALEKRLREGIQRQLDGVVLNGPDDLQRR